MKTITIDHTAHISVLSKLFGRMWARLVIMNGGSLRVCSQLYMEIIHDTISVAYLKKHGYRLLVSLDNSEAADIWTAYKAQSGLALFYAVTEPTPKRTLKAVVPGAELFLHLRVRLPPEADECINMRCIQALYFKE